jgi:CO/xanthine dehydrogenase FAD-binding subunit
VRQRNTREETGNAYWNDRCRTHRRNLAKHFVAAGHEVALSNARGTETLGDLVASLGPSARAMTPTTALEPAEIITSVEFPAWASMTGGSAYEKHTNPATCYPICRVAASVVATADNSAGECRVAATGVFDRPSRLSEVEAAIEGTVPTRASVKEASRHAGAGGAARSDLFASSEYRSHLATVLAE